MRVGAMGVLTVLFLAGVCFPSFCFADKVVLGNGDVIEGSIVEENPEYVKVDTAGVIQTYYSADIKEVKRDLVSQEEKSLIKNQSVYLILEKVKSLRKENRYEEAIEELKKAVKIEPKNILLYASIAELYYTVGQDDQSLAYCQKVLAMSPGEPHTLACLALVNYQLGKYEEGRKLFRQFQSSFKPVTQRQKDYLKRTEDNVNLLEQIAGNPDIPNKEEIKKSARKF